MLLRAALERIGEDRIHLGRRVKHVDSGAGGVKLELADPGGEHAGQASGLALIAADGIHSAVRRQFYPDEGPPVWNGAIMWRGVADAPSYLDGHTMIMAGHPAQKFVCYPISHQGAAPGHQCINFIAEQRAPVADGAAPEQRQDWTRRARVEDFLSLFEDWAFDWLDVPALIRSSDAVWI